MSLPLIERKVDELGRIVLPIDLRRAMDISEHDTLEIRTEGDCILLRKKQNSCVFCGGAAAEDAQFRGRCICAACRKELEKQFRA